MEGLELLIGTLAGFITAFLAEPVKIKFANKIERDNLQIALYREMVNMYNGWTGFLGLIQKLKVGGDSNSLKKNVKINTRVEGYDYIRKTNPVLFYNLKEAASIDVVYRNFLTAKEMISEKGEEGLLYAQAACQVIERFLQEGKLNKKLFLEVNASIDEVHKDS